MSENQTLAELHLIFYFYFIVDTPWYYLTLLQMPLSCGDSQENLKSHLCQENQTEHNDLFAGFMMGFNLT